MADLSCSRRGFLGKSSLVAAAAAIPSALYMTRADAPILIASAERAPAINFGEQVLTLEGDRLARLHAMVGHLGTLTGDIRLRLDATDDALLDVAADMAGVRVQLQHQGTVDQPDALVRITKMKGSLA